MSLYLLAECKPALDFTLDGFRPTVPDCLDAVLAQSKKAKQLHINGSIDWLEFHLYQYITDNKLSSVGLIL